jgi:hypothetical protein
MAPDIEGLENPARQVVALFELHHNVLHAFGGADLWWNLPLTSVSSRTGER